MSQADREWWIRKLYALVFVVGALVLFYIAFIVLVTVFPFEAPCGLFGQQNC